MFPLIVRCIEFLSLTYFFLGPSKFIVSRVDRTSIFEVVVMSFKYKLVTFTIAVKANVIDEVIVCGKPKNEL